MFAWIQALLLLLLSLLTCPRLVLPEQIIGSVPPLPSQGVRLYSGTHNTTIPNYSVIAARDFSDGDNNEDGLNNGLWCQSASSDGDSGGVWYYPNGSVVLSTDIDAVDPRYSPLHVSTVSGQTGLLRDGGLMNFSGLFVCKILDENGNEHTLTVGAFTNYEYDKMGEPYWDGGATFLNGNSTFSLVSTREADPPVFTVSFNVTHLPPTYVECDIDGVAIGSDSEETITRKVIQAEPPVMTTVTVFVKQRSQGKFHCLVSAGADDGLLRQSNITTTITAVDSPTNFVSTRTGPTTATVSWSAPSKTTTPVTGYEVFYRMESGEIISGGETSASQLSLVLTSLQPDVSYMAFVVAFGSSSTLPSAHSNTFRIPATPPRVELSDQSVTFGLNATFICNAIGFGLSHFFWTYPPTTRPVNITDNTLTVIGVSKNEEGTYTCRVSDDYGNNASSSASLQVNDLPRERFRVRGGAFQDCTKWNATMQSSVGLFMITAVDSAVQNYCQCDLPSMYIYGPELLCDEQNPNWVVLTADIISYGEHSAQQLVGYIQDWITQGATSTSGLAVIAFDPNCPVSIRPGTAASCPVASPTICTEPTVSSSTPTPTDSWITSVPVLIAMTAVITILATAIVIVTIVLVVGCLLQKHSRHRLRAKESMLNRQLDRGLPVDRTYESLRKTCSTYEEVPVTSTTPVKSSCGYYESVVGGDVHNPVYAPTAEPSTCTESIYESFPGEV